MEYGCRCRAGGKRLQSRPRPPSPKCISAIALPVDAGRLRMNIVTHVPSRGGKMEYRELGRTGWRVSTLSFGAWAIGGTWGPVDDDESMAALRRALEHGVTFFDTADVYGDGRSERLLARLRKETGASFYVATKAGRRLNPHVAEGYNRENLTAFVERSLRNLEVEAIDMLQLHCPPTEVFYMPEVFGILDDLVAAGKLRFY